MSPPAINVLLLTERDCALCDHAWEVIERLRREYPMAVETLEADSPRGQALAAREGIVFAPGVFLDGVAFSYGRLSERRLRRGLERLSSSTEDAAGSTPPEEERTKRRGGHDRGG